MSFSVELWDGFEKIVSRFDLQFTVCNDYVGYFKKRAKAELEFGKDLTDLNKAPPGGGFLNSHGPSVLKVEKTMREALLSLTVGGTKIAQKHSEAGKKITDEIVKPFEAFLKTAESEKKKLASDGDKKLKVLKDAIAAATKAKDAYEKASKEAEAAREAHNKAAADLAAQPENKKAIAAAPKAEQAMRKAEEKAAAADAQYQNAVKAANDAQSKTYNDELPRLLSDLQRLFEEVFKQLAKYLTIAVDVQSLFSPEEAAVADMMVAKIAKEISLESDLREFVDASKSDKLSPIPIKYVPYGKAAEASTSGASPVPEPAVEEPKKASPEPKEEEAAAAAAAPAEEEPAQDARPDPASLLAPAPTTDSLF